MAGEAVDAAAAQMLHVRAQVSKSYQCSSLLLKPGMPLLWNDAGGLIQFFAEQNSEVALVYEELQKVRNHVPWTKTLDCSGNWKSIDIYIYMALVQSGTVPCWWLKEGTRFSRLTCLI